jgi:hypothetical protein
VTTGAAVVVAARGELAAWDDADGEVALSVEEGDVAASVGAAGVEALVAPAAGLVGETWARGVSAEVVALSAAGAIAAP